MSLENAFNIYFFMSTYAFTTFNVNYCVVKILPESFSFTIKSSYPKTDVHLPYLY